MVRLLDRAVCFRGYRSAVRTGNGPELTSRAFIAWSQRRGIEHLLFATNASTSTGSPRYPRNTIAWSNVSSARCRSSSPESIESQHHAAGVVGDWVQFYKNRRPASGVGLKMSAEA